MSLNVEPYPNNKLLTPCLVSPDLRSVENNPFRALEQTKLENVERK